MQLGHRLLLVGAVLPAVLLLLALVVGGVALDRILHREIDRALLSQTAVEAVSLFDRVGAPHLHLVTSPLDSRVREFAPRGALYGPDGQLITRYPESASVPATLDPSSLAPDARLTTEVIDGAAHRVVGMRVVAPSGAPHALWLAASLETHDSAVRVYWQFTGCAVLLVVGLLAVVQISHARQLDRRVSAIAQHMQRLREGDLSSSPGPDKHGDIIRVLRDDVALTTLRLAAARHAQERLLADAAHELRTPLTAMRAAIDIALRRVRTAEELEEVLRSVREEVGRLGDLASRLLDMAAIRGAPIELAKGDFCDVLREAVEAARFVAEAREIVIDLHAPAHAPAEFAASVLRQAVDNLLDNAIKFSPSGAKVVVELEQAGPEWILRVTDAGPGVDPAARDRIFEAFEREHQRVQGKGIGLAIVREVAQRHGGWCSVEERLGGQTGSIFSFAIRASQPTV